jgi:hypothetical protein
MQRNSTQQREHAVQHAPIVSSGHNHGTAATAHDRSQPEAVDPDYVGQCGCGPCAAYEIERSQDNRGFPGRSVGDNQLAIQHRADATQELVARGVYND